jgi:hypothetical protein
LFAADAADDDDDAEQPAAAESLPAATKPGNPLLLKWQELRRDDQTAQSVTGAVPRVLQAVPVLGRRELARRCVNSTPGVAKLSAALSEADTGVDARFSTRARQVAIMRVHTLHDQPHLFLRGQRLNDETDGRHDVGGPFAFLDQEKAATTSDRPERKCMRP